MRVSICIPQYNRSAYLLKSLESIRDQTYPDIEVVVADDCSTDDTEIVIPAYLRSSGLQHKYFRHSKNLGYDANLRSALRAGSGEYLMVLGNDDGLPEPNTIAELVRILDAHGRPSVAFGNYYTGPNREHLSDRAGATENLGHGVDVALSMFRAFSCVTALVFKREAYLNADTDRYDGSIYVQMYLGPRIVGQGGDLLAIEAPLAVCGLEVGGKHANSYLDRLHEFRWRIRPAVGGLDQVGRVVCDALQPLVHEGDRQRVAWHVFRQLLMYSYPYWLYDYRKHGELWASLNLALGCFPPSLTRHISTSPLTLAKLIAVYASTTTVGVMVPLGILSAVEKTARNISKRIR